MNAIPLSGNRQTRTEASATPSTERSTATRTIDQLRLSPLNVRTYGPDANDTEALQASILADGLINAIAVHPMKGAKDQWGAVAGGRRYRAIKALIARGALPTDWPIRVNVLEGMSDAELIEHSITENLIRRDLRDHELYAGVARANARGHDPEQIARNLGQPDVATVARWLRLGQLADPVFAAFADGTIGIDQAKAFAATGDKDLQRATFDRFGRADRHRPSPAEIRRAMAFGDDAARRELLFVGDEAYRAEGGSFELDMFAEIAEERGRVTNAALLRQLVDRKLALVRDETRVATQQRDLRFIPEPPQSEWGGTDHQLAVTPRRHRSGTIDLPDGEVVAHVGIDGAGEAVVTYWWASRKAKFGNEKPKAKASEATALSLPAIGTAVADPYSAKPRADAAIRKEEGLSQDAIFALSAVRKTLLRAAMIDDAHADGDVGQDYLVWAQARMLMSEKPLSAIGIRGIVSANMVAVSGDALALARDQIGATEASQICARTIGAIATCAWMTEPDLGLAFAAYRCTDDQTKRLVAAIAAGLALERSLAAPGYETPIHDVVAHECGADRDEVLRGYWTPTANMIGLFPKDQRRAFAEPFVARGDFATWAKLKSSELTAAVVRVLTRAGGRGASWVHPLLRFGAKQAADAAFIPESTKIEEAA